MNNILLTGGSGKLGKAIIASGYFSSILSPSSATLDITKPKRIEKYLNENTIDAIIHCAALARMSECEKDPAKALHVNSIGTAYLVAEILKREIHKNNKIRFIYISTDGVYPGIRGNYSENDETIPYNKYGWTKLGGECAVNLLSNYCIIRTSFFDPSHIMFDNSAIDSYSSKVPIDYLVKAIAIMLKEKYVGVINIGSKRTSDYKRYKKYKPQIKPCKLIDIKKNVDFKMATDASLNSNKWERIKK
ncbi:MAG: ligand-binding protein RmlD family [Candidatus Saganbacteria bacterium]|uniref:Ligand-binding protein RmlD family n=1 Tax=Candidatus Saganbacteria bacterium TaxID=2575572 RepID=A0A833L4Y9_UNCSA|nr:MAG: ligand-binding protein RmlD family [Candidatus Saganbacteria bacterium]